MGHLGGGGGGGDDLKVQMCTYETPNYIFCWISLQEWFTYS